MDKIFASSDLTGKIIGQWVVGDRIENEDISFRYSLLYQVDCDGKKAIMKVIDSEKCNNGPLEDGIGRNELISRETTAFNYEQKAARQCAGLHMNNVISYLDSGETEVDGYLIPTVTYIVYELSEGKIGDFLVFSSMASFVADLGVLKDKLWSLHEVAKGIKQLHTNLIAHHNITPHSIEVFDDNSKFKLGDLHHSKSQKEDLQSPENAKLFNGDLTFAPPEVFFAYKIPDEMAAYYQVDTYMLGNLIVYYLTGLNMTTLLNRYLPYTLKEWAKNGANYMAVQPDITNAFCKILAVLREAISIDELREPIIKMIECLCNPDPDRRGYPGGFKSSKANADLQRIITKLDILYDKAELLLYKKNYK